MNKRILALFLALLLLPGCPTAWGEAATQAAYHWYDDTGLQHAALSLEEMPYEVYDPEHAYALLAELEALGQAAGNDAGICQCFQELIGELNRAQTDYALAQLRYSEDMAADTYTDDIVAINDTINTFLDDLYQALAGLLAGDYGQLISQLLDDAALTEELQSYTEMEDALLELSHQAAEAVQRYNELTMEEISVTVDGETYTLDSAEEIEDDDRYWEVYTALAQEQNALLAPVLLDLISLYNQAAELGGYDSAAQMFYESQYGRDFTPEDARKLHAAVKESIVPLHQEVEALLTSYPAQNVLGDLTAGEIMDIVGSYIGKVDPDLALSFAHMSQGGLYAIDFYSGRGDGYTIPLPQYSDAAIFIDLLGDDTDVETLIHEFGHYNAMFHQNMNALNFSFSMDTSEIHSQGLEVLFLPYADDIYGAGNGMARKLNVIYSILDSIIQGCLQDEFQQEAYAAAKDHTLTVEELNRLAYRLYSEYGMNIMPGAEQLYGWVTIPHTFEVPFYYISYAASAVNALDILSISQADYQEAVDTYMSLTALPASVSYQDVLAQVGLHNTFEPDTLQFIRAGVEDYIASLTAISAAA